MSKGLTAALATEEAKRCKREQEVEDARRRRRRRKMS